MNSTITPTHLLQVFEHQTLRVGDEINDCIFSKKHFHALARYSEKHGGKYYSLLFNGVKFSHYVGAIQIGHLTIEVLPKADKKENPDVYQWHDVLMDMLKECRLIKVETLASARLQLRTNSILELYFEIFLKEIEKLLRKGLFRSYRKVNFAKSFGYFGKVGVVTFATFESERNENVFSKIWKSKFYRT